MKLLASHYCPKTELGPALFRASIEGYCCNSDTIEALANCGADVNYVNPEDGEKAGIGIF